MTHTPALLPCPLCKGPMQFRKALWPSDGNVDAIMHGSPTDCCIEFSDGSIDESIIAKWNAALAQSPAPPVGNEALREALKIARKWMLCDNEFGDPEDFKRDLAAVDAALAHETGGGREDVRCYGCGSAWTDDDLRLAKAKDPEILSCCPERKPLNITEWMARAVAAEQRLSVPPAAPVTREDIARTLAQKLWCGATFDEASPSEREAFLAAADAVISGSTQMMPLPAAPATVSTQDSRTAKIDDAALAEAIKKMRKLRLIDHVAIKDSPPPAVTFLAIMKQGLGGCYEDGALEYIFRHFLKYYRAALSLPRADLGGGSDA